MRYYKVDHDCTSNTSKGFEDWQENVLLTPVQLRLFKAMSEEQRISFVSERAWQAANLLSEKRIKKLEDQKQKYREALEHIAEQSISMHICVGDMALRCKEIAGEALKEGEE